MDIFAVGCVLFEIFNDGEPLFDYSRLLAYRRGEHDVTQSFSNIQMPELTSLIMHMIQIDPSKRLTAKDYLQRYPSAVDFEGLIPNTLHLHFSQVLMMDADSRATFVADSWTHLFHTFTRKDLDGKYIESEHTDPSCIEPCPSEDSEYADHDIAFYKGLPESTRLYLEAMELLEETRNIFDLLSSSSKSDSKKKSDMFQGSLPLSQNNFKKDSSVERPIGHGSDLWRSICDEELLCVSNEGMILLMNIICAVYRGSRHQSVRVNLLNQLCMCAKLCGDDNVRIQHAVPHLIMASIEPYLPSARCSALRNLSQVINCIGCVSYGEIRSFSDYILPSLSLLPIDGETSVQTAYAGILTSLALAAHRAIEGTKTISLNEEESISKGQCAKTSSKSSIGGTDQAPYDEEMFRFRKTLERTLHDFLVGPHLGPKISLLPKLHDIVLVLERRDTADGLLPALLTLFNSRDWQVRSSLYFSLEGVLRTLGRPGVAFLAPFFDRMLSDNDNHASVAAAEFLKSMCVSGLLQRKYLLSAARKAAEFKAKSPSPAVRASASRLLEAITSSIPAVTVLALLTPNLESLNLGKPFYGFSLQEEGTKFPPVTISIKHRDRIGEKRFHTFIPSMWYSISLELSDIQRATSHLDAAKSKSQKCGGTLLQVAQRHVIKSNVIPSPDVMESNYQEISRDRRTQEARNDSQTSRFNGETKPTKGNISSSKFGSLDSSFSEQWRPRGILLAHLPSHKSAITRLASHKKTSIFVSVGQDGVANVWDSCRLERDISFEPRAQYIGHGEVPIRAAVMPIASDVVVSGDAKGSLHVWNIERASSGRRTAWGLKDRQRKELKGGPIMDLFSWSSQVISASTRTSVIGLDLREPYWKNEKGQEGAWQLPVSASDGVVTRITGDIENGFWLVSGTSRGVMCLWDTRMLLPLQRWVHPTKARIEALAFETMTTSQTLISDPVTQRYSYMKDSSDCPVIYAAAGLGEVSAWNAVTGQCNGVVRVCTSESRAKPEALAIPMPELGGSDNPVGKAAYLGAPELRSLAARPKGIRALLPLGDGTLMTAGSDSTVRLWDCRSEKHKNSYVVVASPLYGKIFAPSNFSVREVNGLPVLEDHGYPERTTSSGQQYKRNGEGVGTSKGSKNRIPDSDIEQRRDSLHQWDRIAAVAHECPIIDMVQIQGRAEPLLATASSDGVIKVWR